MNFFQNSAVGPDKCNVFQRSTDTGFKQAKNRSTCISQKFKQLWLDFCLLNRFLGLLFWPVTTVPRSISKSVCYMRFLYTISFVSITHSIWSHWLLLTLQKLREKMNRDKQILPSNKFLAQLILVYIIMFSIHPFYDPLVLNLNLFFFHGMKTIFLWGKSFPSPPVGSFSLPFSPHLALRTVTYLTPCLFILFVGLEYWDQWGFWQSSGMNPGWQDPPLLTPNRGIRGLSLEGAALSAAVATVSLSPSSETSRSGSCSHGPYDRPVINCSSLQTKNLAIQLPDP